MYIKVMLWPTKAGNTTKFIFSREVYIGAFFWGYLLRGGL